MKKKVRRIRGEDLEVKLFGRKGAGIKSTISISKTRKITARRKKRIEKGIRAFLLGSKPHSKGEHFSRSSDERNEIVRASNKTTIGIIRAVNKVRLVNIILQK